MAKLSYEKPEPKPIRYMLEFSDETEQDAFRVLLNTGLLNTGTDSVRRLAVSLRDQLDEAEQ